MHGPADPIAFELFKNAVFSIADEMALTVVRTTYSGVIKSVMDFSTSFADADGKMVAQGLTLPGHLGSIPTALDTVMRTFGENIGEGDVFVLNDPFAGGMHLPDIFVFKPIFYEGERLAFAATVCHHTDMGGRVAGSNASDSTEIFQEGLRIPPLKLYEAGRRNDTLFALIERNVRVPISVVGDIRAQLAACHTGETQFLELVRRTGVAQSRALMQEVIDYAERLTRNAIAQLPDGDWSFEDWIDDDGIDRGRRIRLFVTFTKRGDHITADWAGSSPQVKGAINATLSFTKAATYTAVRSILPGDIPNNEGVFRTIEVQAPPGTVCNVVMPGACAARGLTGFRMVDCAFGALAKMVPDRVFAASEGGATGISIGGYGPDRTPFIYVDFAAGTWGGRPWADGLDGNSNMFGNLAAQSIELVEAEQPLRIWDADYVTDRAGAGRYRGGVPYCRAIELLADEAVLQVRSDRREVRPYGLNGGYPGKPSLNFMMRQGRSELLPSKLTLTMRRGDVFRHEIAGGGGWGDPLERDPAAVLRDVRNGLVSPQAAAAEYGVIVDTAAWAVDEAATARARTRIRAARGPDALQGVMWHQPDHGATTV